MIVCSCNVLTDHDVRTAVTADRTPRTTGQVYGCLGCSAHRGRRASPGLHQPAARVANAARAASIARERAPRANQHLITGVFGGEGSDRPLVARRILRKILSYSKVAIGARDKYQSGGMRTCKATQG